MKLSIQLSVTAIFSLISVLGFSQKKTQSFTVERIINAPAAAVWKVVGVNYGDVADSHPGLVASEYVGDQHEGGEGCVRICYLNEEKTKYTQEKQLNFDTTNYTFTVQISHVEKIPLDADNSTAVYKVVPVDAKSSKIIIEMNLRTNPAFMGALAKGKFRKNIEDYAIAIQHNVLTGEKVNQENFKKIKAKYEG